MRFVLILLPFLGVSQTATIRGVILDNGNMPISNVSIKTGNSGTTTNDNGFYELRVPIHIDVSVEFTHLSHKRITAKFNLKNGQDIEFNPVMNINIEQIATVIINNSQRHAENGVTVR